MRTIYKVNGGNSGQWVTTDSDSSCSESAAADNSAGKGRCMWRWGSFPSGGDVGGGRFAAKTVAVRSYPLSGVPPPIYLNYWVGSRNVVLEDAGFSITNGVVLANRHIIFRALVAPEPLVSLISRFGACSARISGDRQTDRQTGTHTRTRAHTYTP